MKGQARVLILDDEILIGMALAEELAAHGFTISGPHKDVISAQEAFKSAPPDMAFLDINLGEEETSLDFARLLKKRGTPFAFLTGYSELPMSREEFANVPILSKPVPTKAALEAAQAMLKCVP